MSLRHRLIKADTIQPPNDPVVAAAEYADAAIARDLQDAFTALGEQIDQQAVRQAIAAHNYQAIIDLIPQEQLGEDLAAALTRLVDVSRETAALAVQALADRAEIRIAFDQLAPRFTNLMVDMRTGLIQGMTKEAQETLQAIIVDGFQRGIGTDQIALNIRGMISLGQSRARAVLNYQASLQNLDSRALDYTLRDARFDGSVSRAIGQGIDLPNERIDRMVARYAERQLGSRARTIARTEALRAANVGYRAGYQQMADKGLLDKAGVTRKWLVAPDEVTCEICQSIAWMNADGVGMDEEFDSIDGPVLDPPDPHPNCRCSVVYHIAANAIGKAFDPGEERDEHGRWSSSGGGSPEVEAEPAAPTGVRARIKAFMAGPGRDAIRTIGHKLDENKVELLAGAVTFSLYHIAGADFPMDVESAVHDQVLHFADNAKVSIAMARDTMHQAVDKMIALRLGKAERDDVLEALRELKTVLEKMSIA